MERNCCFSLTPFLRSAYEAGEGLLHSAKKDAELVEKFLSLIDEYWTLGPSLYGFMIEVCLDLNQVEEATQYWKKGMVLMSYSQNEDQEQAQMFEELKRRIEEDSNDF